MNLIPMFIAILKAMGYQFEMWINTSTAFYVALFKMFIFSSDLAFPFWQDGQDSDDPKQSPADMTAFVSFFSLIK